MQIKIKGASLHQLREDFKSIKVVAAAAGGETGRVEFGVSAWIVWDDIWISQGQLLGRYMAEREMDRRGLSSSGWTFLPCEYDISCSDLP